MKYVRRYLEEVEVIKRTEDTVTYLTEVKAQCVMCVSLFDERYEEKQGVSYYDGGILSIGFDFEEKSDD
jgi:hypothetical protein